MQLTEAPQREFRNDEQKLMAIQSFKENGWRYLTLTDDLNIICLHKITLQACVLCSSCMHLRPICTLIVEGGF